MNLGKQDQKVEESKDSKEDEHGVQLLQALFLIVDIARNRQEDAEGFVAVCLDQKHKQEEITLNLSGRADVERHLAVHGCKSSDILLLDLYQKTHLTDFRSKLLGAGLYDHHLQQFFPLSQQGNPPLNLNEQQRQALQSSIQTYIILGDVVQAEVTTDKICAAIENRQWHDYKRRILMLYYQISQDFKRLQGLSNQELQSLQQKQQQLWLEMLDQISASVSGDKPLSRSLEPISNAPQIQNQNQNSGPSYLNVFGNVLNYGNVAGGPSSNPDGSAGSLPLNSSSSSRGIRVAVQDLNTAETHSFTLLYPAVQTPLQKIVTQMEQCITAFYAMMRS